MIELERRMRCLEERVNSLVQVGIVTEVVGGSVRVKINGKASHKLQVLSPRTHKDKFFAMPDVGEEVVCIFLPFGLAQGFVLGAAYSSEDAPPAEGPHVTQVNFEDGSSMIYDRKKHSLDITVNGGKVTVKADKVNLDCGGDMGGVITDKSICKFDGKPHVDASQTVIASK